MGTEYPEIHELLYRLGVTENYKGFSQMACATRLCAEEQERLTLVTKRLYPEVAKRYHTSWQTIERNLRTVGNVIWKRNGPLLETLARRPLDEKPRNTELLAILSHSLARSHHSPLAVHGLGEAVALAGEDHDMGVVDEPVDEGGGEAVIAKDGVPLGELQI